MTAAPLADVSVIPVLRSFDEAKAREFWCDFMGFKVDWEHRFEPGLPLYMQVSRGGLALHISEHHGDGSPGIVVFVRMSGLKAFNAELLAKNYRNLRPGIQEQEWGMREMTVIDPFGNRIRFSEPMETA
jgi:catechol 2,3-dioxygenase-like lactoylglutathione lyase family enzyme